MKRYGLIGGVLTHSWSARHFARKFEREGIADCQYELYPAGEKVRRVDELRPWLHSLVQEQGLRGLNVTIPFKQWILPCLDEISDEAREIGAVNCVKVDWQGGTPWLVGYNTDAPAFLASIRPLLKPWHTDAVVLGTGGAARAVAFALRQIGIGSALVSRTPTGEMIGYVSAVEKLENAFLLINCTPVGMSPNEAQTPWKDTHTLSFRHLCYDLVYNPEDTRFLLEASLSGASTKGGLEMLRRQAELSWDIWKGQPMVTS
ncbi:MAG: shikimate dehydrogenase [Bacteroidales bacterium]|nr:shikimate dehydrogenase [Bacteroidales bacterium]